MTELVILMRTLSLETVPEKGDLSMIWPRFAHWLLMNVRQHAKGISKKAVESVAELYARRLNGDKPRKDEWITVSVAAKTASVESASWGAKAAWAVCDKMSIGANYEREYAEWEAWVWSAASADSAANAAKVAWDPSAANSDWGVSKKAQFEKLKELLKESK